MIEAGGPSSLVRGEEEGLPKKARADELAFSGEDLKEVQYPHDDALVVSLNMDNYGVHRVLIDSGSSFNVLYFDAFMRLKFRVESLRPMESALEGFAGDSIIPEEVITLSVRAGTWPCVATMPLGFLVTRLKSSYNAILGRPGQMFFKAIISVPYLAMKFPTEWGVGVVKGSSSSQAILCSGRHQSPNLSSKESFSSNWEGPYQIEEVIRPGIYKLQELNGRLIPRT